MHLLHKNWHRAKRQLARQTGAREQAAARRRERKGPEDRCEHQWTLVMEEQTWSGPMRLSTCAACPAMLHEWDCATNEATSVNAHLADHG